jgi:hypothetical protein
MGKILGFMTGYELVDDRWIKYMNGSDQYSIWREQ